MDHLPWVTAERINVSKILFEYQKAFQHIHYGNAQPVKSKLPGTQSTAESGRGLQFDIDKPFRPIIMAA
jgi:hypothetical protein